MRPRTFGDSDRARGVLLGSAIGDAVGRPVEFLSLDEIRGRFGEGTPDPDGALVPTDDTGMTMAVAEALATAGTEGPEALMEAVVREFVRWRRDVRDEDRPGTTCLEATSRLAAGVAWQEAAVSWSKGNGAVMRTAPVGFFFAGHPFLLREVARSIARTTHGHPTAECAAVAASVVVREALADTTPDQWAAIALEAIARLPAWEVRDALEALPASLEATNEVEAMERLGEGWTAEEALVMALTAVLRHPDDFAAAIRCAVRHGGDSDTVGCIAGAISGARLGERGLPSDWVDRLSGTDRIRSLADRLDAARDRLV